MEIVDYSSVLLLLSSYLKQREFMSRIKCRARLVGSTVRKHEPRTHLFVDENVRRHEPRAHLFVDANVRRHEPRAHLFVDANVGLDCP
jgi:hypothetical protein